MVWPKGLRKGRDLRPVRDPNEPEVPVVESLEAAQIEQQAEVKMEEVKVKVAEPKKEPRFVPFTGKESLPQYTMVKGRVVLGAPRYALMRGDGKRYKLLAYRRTPAGVERTLARVLVNGGADKPLFESLKKAGIPGAF